MNSGSVAALLRAAWRTALSYRLSMVLSIGSLALTVVPVYFISNALQPMMGKVISAEGPQYFGFLLLGTVSLSFVGASMGALPGAIGGGISSGYVEWLFTTPVSRPALFVGLSAYPILWTTVRAVLMLVAGWALGATITLSRLPTALLVFVLLIVAHWAVGLIGTALLLAFRTMGPLPQAVLIGSALFGGTYWPTTSIPTWLQSFASITPLAFGLRALRSALLEGAAQSSLVRDIAILALFAVGLLAAGSVAVTAALRYAQRRGTLNLY